MPEQDAPRHFQPHAESWRATPSPAELAGAAAIVAAAVVVAHLLRGTLPAPSFALLFLIAVLIASIRYGFWTGIAASLLAFLAYNFFFVEPLYTLRVAEAEDALALCVLLAAAALTGFLAGRLREEADAAKARAGLLEQLATFTSDLDAAATPGAIERMIVEHIAAIDGGSAVLLHPHGGRLAIEAAVPSGLELDDAALEAAERAYRRGTEEQPAAPGWSGSAFAFSTLGPGQGVIGYRSDRTHARLQVHTDQLRRTMLRQGQVALDRAHFAAEAEVARTKAEREALRAALLSSLSHDLKTPLATILGGVSSLRELGDALTQDARSDLLLAVEEEAERLSHYVSNLLHMTRLNAGVDLRLEWIDAADIAHSAVERARRSFSGRRIAFAAPAALPLVRGGAVLLEQALFNLIDNAVKFSPPQSEVQVAVTLDTQRLRISVSDSGPGIARGDLSRVFEPFFRGANAAASGIGLGLAIASGIVQALSGKLVPESPIANELGTRMTIELPLTATEPSP